MWYKIISDRHKCIHNRHYYRYSLKRPPVIRRPKGAEKTVIGLHSRKKFKGDQVRMPVSFLKKSTSNKDEGRLIKAATAIIIVDFFAVILSWFVDRQGQGFRRGRCGDKTQSEFQLHVWIRMFVYKAYINTLQHFL